MLELRLLDESLAVPSLATRAIATTILVVTGLVSPLDSPYNATGDGTANDAAEYAAADAALNSIWLPGANTFNTDTYLPVKGVFGTGALKVNGETLDGFQLLYDAINANIVFTPKQYYGAGTVPAPIGIGYSSPPNNATEGHLNVVIASAWRQGMSTFPANNDIRRSTFIGAEIGLLLQKAERVEGIGNGSHKFATFSERNTGVGTLNFQFVGTNPRLDPNGLWYGHAIFNDPFSGFDVDDASWDFALMETNNPGIRAQLAAFSNWPTTTDEVSRNCCYGRDSMGAFITGKENSAYGYRSLGTLIDGADNSAFGRGALERCVFTNSNSGFGNYSGWQHQEGHSNVYVGYYAGFSHLKGGNNVIIGAAAGWSGDNALWEGNYNVLIGDYAGCDVDGNIAADMTDRLFIHNYFSRNPLISGYFDTGLIGLNLPKDNATRTYLHQFVGASGLAIGTTITSTHANFLIESNTHTGLGFLTPANMVQGLYFYKASATFSGSLVYDHSVDRFKIKCALEAQGVEFGASGVFKIANLPTASPGAGTKQFWVDGADGNTVKFAV